MEYAKIEYRVRPVTRYVVTRFYQSVPLTEGGNCAGGCSPMGEFDNYSNAYDVGYALAKLEHEQQGWPLGDERIQYPKADHLNTTG